MAQNGTAAHFDLAQGSSAPTNRLYSKLLQRDPADGYKTLITDLATAVDDGTVPTIGEAPPTIIATTIRTGHEGEAT